MRRSMTQGPIEEGRMNKGKTGARFDGKTDVTSLAVKSDYKALRPHLEQFVMSIACLLQAAPGVYAIKSNCKDLTGILADIARARAEGGPEAVTIENYPVILNEIALVKVLFLQNTDARAVHEYICRTWNLRVEPLAVVPSADPIGLKPLMKSLGCTIMEKADSATRIDYRIESNHFKRPLVATIRVISIIDDMWTHFTRMSDAVAEQGGPMELSGVLARRMIDNGMFAAIGLQKSIVHARGVPQAPAGSAPAFAPQSKSPSESTLESDLELDKTSSLSKTISFDGASLSESEFSVVVDPDARETSGEIHIEDLAATISMAKTDLTRTRNPGR